MRSIYPASRTTRPTGEASVLSDAIAFSYARGFNDGLASAENHADLTARRLIAQCETTEARKALTRSAADFLKVPRVQQRPTPGSTAATAPPSLEAFMAGLRRGGILRDQQAVAA